MQFYKVIQNLEIILYNLSLLKYNADIKQNTSAYGGMKGCRSYEKSIIGYVGGFDGAAVSGGLRIYRKCYRAKQ